jgi:UDP-glucose 4-epimerase
MIEEHGIGRCLVLGGRGFIGSHLVDALLDQGISTRVLIRRPPADAGTFAPYRSHDLLEVLTGDFNNEMDLLGAMDDCDSCVHLISTTLPSTSNQDMIYDIQTNLVGTVRLLRYAKRTGLSKLVFVSSGGAVYGDARARSIDEDHPTNPRSSYGITKLASEKYLSLHACETLSTTALRLSNPYGPRQRTMINQGAVAVFLDRAMRGEAIDIWGNGEVVRDYIFIDDCVAAIVKALEYRGPETLFNVGSGSGRSLNQIVSCIEALLGGPIDVNYTVGRSVDPAHNILNVERARKHLGWQPLVSFEEGLARTALWYSQNKPYSALPLAARGTHTHPIFERPLC